MVISSIQRAANYIYQPIHHQVVQITSADWKKKTMLMGLIISVCCAVITFFTQTTFIWSAFAILSGVCGLGTLYMHHYKNLKKMKEYTKVLQEENQTFNAHNQDLESLVIEQRKNTTFLTVENSKLKTEVTKLTIHTDYLTKTSQELIHSVEDLRVNLLTLESIIKASPEIEKKLSAFSTKMDKQQEISKHLIELIYKTMTEESDQLALKQEILHQLQSLQSNDMTLQKVKELNLLQQQLSSIHDKLRSALEEYADLQNKTAQISNQLAHIQIQSQLENTRLQEVRQELSKVSCELKNTHLAQNAVLSKYHSLLLKYEGIIIV